MRYHSRRLFAKTDETTVGQRDKQLAVRGDHAGRRAAGLGRPATGRRAVRGHPNRRVRAVAEAHSAAFPRVAEIVTSDDESKKRSRQHFAEYRNEGHKLDSHKL